MDEPPMDHAICACCGTHFGYDDVTKSYLYLRNDWLLRGGIWFDTDDPAYPRFLGWNAWDQLDVTGYHYDVIPQTNVTTEIKDAPSRLFPNDPYGPMTQMISYA
jgi:hypothetical protein